jgi:hypothetical protein
MSNMKKDGRSNPRRSNAPIRLSLEETLKGVKERRFYVDSIRRNFNLDWVLVHVNSIPEVNLKKPFEVQRIKFADKKRGNLKPYAGKRCDVILASKRVKNGPNVYLYLKEV